jgi:putative redox protein
VPRNVIVKSGPLKYAQNITVGPHRFQADEPTDVGGNDVGPEAHELVMAALGACANITVQMYAERKQWPLHGVQVALSYARVPAENPADSGAKIGMMDRIDVEVALVGDLSEEQQRRLLEIADRCPVHRLLVSGVEVNTRLFVPASPPH